MDNTAERCGAQEPGAAWHVCSKPKGHPGDHGQITGPMPWPVWDAEPTGAPQ